MSLSDLNGLWCKVQSRYDACFIFGRKGRFGSSFVDSLKEIEPEIFEYSTSEFNEGVENLVRHLNGKRDVLIFWCLGNGNSAKATSQNQEFYFLNDLNMKLVHNRVPPTNSLFVYISTGGKMYGVNVGQVNEKSEIVPVGLYGIQKRECERLIQQKFSQNFFNTCVYRIANAYTLKWDNPHPQGFLDSCLSAVKFGWNLKFTVNPNSRRQYVPHKDYVQAILNAIWYSSDPIEGTYNLAPNFTYSLNEIVDVFQEHFKKRIYVEPWEKSNLIEDTVILVSKRIENERIFENWQSLELNLKNLIDEVKK
jgi:nucleoside-diphosphate-sugar epimerase